MAAVRSILSRLFPRASTQLFLRAPTLLAIFLFRKRRREPRGRQSIVIFRLDGLGDCVMTLPLLSQVREIFPQAHITVVTTPAAKPIFEMAGDADEILVLEPAMPTALPRSVRYLAGALLLYGRTLRSRRVGTVLSPRWDADISCATFLAALLRAPQAIGYEDVTSPEKSELNRGFQRIWTQILPAGPLQHEVLRNLAVGHALGASVIGQPEPRLSLSPLQTKIGQSWLGQGVDLPVALGLPANEAKRRWDAGRYVGMLRLVSQTYPIVPIVFADADTLSAAHEILSAFPNAKIASGMSLPEVAAILSECVVFVGSDSGLGHLAASVGCPTVTISPHPRHGDPQHANSPIRFLPFSRQSVAVQPHAARPGCENCCMSSVAHCILDVPVEEVAQAVQTFLQAYAAHEKRGSV